MKIILHGLLLASSMLLSNATFASGEQSAEQKVEMKCFVQAYGGAEAIEFANVKSSQLANLKNSLVGTKVLVLGGNKKHKVYKVHECVPLHKLFSSSKAKALDAQTLR